MNWWFLLPVLSIASWSTYHFGFSPLYTEKVNIIEAKPPLSTDVFCERSQIERTILQEDTTYHIYAPSSHLNFASGEKMEHFEIWYDEGNQERHFQGDAALYDFKQQNLFADDFHFSIHQKGKSIFDGLGQNFVFYFQDHKPCFSTKHFTVHLNMEEQ